MPVKKRIIRSKTVASKAAASQRDIKVSLPKIPRLDPKMYSPVLVVLLIVASFLLGSLYTKVQYLESGKGTAALDANTQATQPTAGQQAAAQPTTPAGPVNVKVGDYPPQGDPNAKVKVIEFADFRCPFCEQWFKNVEPQLKKDYVDTNKISFYFVNYAFLGPASITAANAAECANEQGKFWDMHDWFYNNQPSETDTSIYTTDNLTQVAGQLGMDTTQFNSCLSSTKYNKQVSNDLAEGQKDGVNGTPTTFVNGVPIVGAVPYDQIKSAIDAALAK